MATAVMGVLGGAWGCVIGSMLFAWYKTFPEP